MDRNDARLNSSSQVFTMLIIIMASFLTSFLNGAINIAIPAIGEEFKSGALQLGWVMTGFLLGSAVFLVPVGRLSDIIGYRKVFLSGVVLFTLMAALCGTVRSIGTLIAFQAVQGVGAAMIFGTSQAILSSAFPPQKRGQALGLNAGSVYAGFSLGPVLGGVINHWLGWHAVFYICAGIGALISLLGLLKLKSEWAEAVREKYDLAGTVLYMLGLVAFMYGASTITTSAAAKFIMLAGIAVLVVFAAYELRSSFPVLNMRLFSRNKLFAFANLAIFLNYSAIAGISFLLSVYLQVIRGYDSSKAGIILIFQPIVIVVLAPLSGRMSDRVSPRVLASLGVGLTTIGAGMLSLLGEGTALWFIVLNLVILGVGVALFAAPNTNAAMGSVDKQNYGIASSVLGTTRMMGQAISMTVVTLIINIFAGNVELNAADAGRLLAGAKTACGVFAVISLGSFFATLVREKR